MMQDVTHDVCVLTGTVFLVSVGSLRTRMMDRLRESLCQRQTDTQDMEAGMAGSRTKVCLRSVFFILIPNLMLLLIYRFKLCMNFII